MRKMSMTAIGLALSLISAPSALAQTDFAFGDLSAEPETQITVFLTKSGELTGTAASINDETDGRLKQAIEDADFEGKFGKKLHLFGMAPYKSVTVIGTGSEALDMRDLRDLGGHVAQASDNETDLSVMVDDLNTDVDAPAAQLAMGYALGSYSFTKYKEDAKYIDRTVSFHSDDTSDANRLYKNDLSHLVKGVTFARDMGTEPGKSIYPETFAQNVRSLFRNVSGVRVQVMEMAELKRRNMGALVGVGQGSINDPRLIVVTYNGGARNEDPIALVGKGITFDTGGISLKPNSGQWLMKSDLSGAAAVAGTVYSAAMRGADVNLVGVMAMAENMPSQDAIRPGDVLKTMSGKTIEVMSTDAEGRLVLSDAVSYVQQEHDPRLLINIATLTGSAARALGDDYGAVITRDWELSEHMVRIGEEVGEDVWPLPLNNNHFKAIRSDIADIKSTGGSPGASIGGAVIGTFIDDDQPWVHLDIAGVDWLDKGIPTTPKGHAGWGVRFLDGVVRDVDDE